MSEVLQGKKGLSMTMVQRLRARFRVPAELLLPHDAQSTHDGRSGERSEGDRPLPALGAGVTKAHEEPGEADASADCISDLLAQ